jgi:CTP-dependent riboflavin kinase
MAGNWGRKKGLDIFLYGNVMFGHGEGGYYIGRV